jgi:hypothetical protein
MNLIANQIGPSRAKIVVARTGVPADIGFSTKAIKWRLDQEVKRLSNEFFYLDADGKKQDAALHEPILDNPEAVRIGKEISARLLQDIGMSEEGIAKLQATPDGS